MALILFLLSKWIEQGSNWLVDRNLHECLPYYIGTYNISVYKSRAKNLLGLGSIREFPNPEHWSQAMVLSLIMYLFNRSMLWEMRRLVLCTHSFLTSGYLVKVGKETLWQFTLSHIQEIKLTWHYAYEFSHCIGIRKYIRSKIEMHSCQYLLLQYIHLS